MRLWAMIWILFIRVDGGDHSFQAVIAMPPERRVGDDYLLTTDDSVTLCPYEPERDHIEGPSWFATAVAAKSAKSYASVEKPNLWCTPTSALASWPRTCSEAPCRRTTESLAQSGSSRIIGYARSIHHVCWFSRGTLQYPERARLTDVRSLLAHDHQKDHDIENCHLSNATLSARTPNWGYRRNWAGR